MNRRIGAIYHILLYFQYDIWTTKLFEGQLVLKVLKSSDVEVLLVSLSLRIKPKHPQFGAIASP